MNDFSPWTLFTDTGLIALLLLTGKLLRTKVRLVQRLFIPPSLMAGFMGLALGPNGLGWLPLSHQLGTYAGILIAFIFSCLPFTGSRQAGKNKGILKMWAYSQTGMLWQWAFGGLLGIWLLDRIWQTGTAFGIAMPSGFCGGHGTAAAIGEAFARFGDTDMLTLAMTAATVGIVASVFIGLGLIKWGTRRGHTSFLSDFSQLPEELRTGLLPPEKRESLGDGSCSSISMDPLTLHFAFIALIALGGYGISQLVAVGLPQLQLPVFSCAFVVGILAKWLCTRSKTIDYLSPTAIGHLSGTFTDLLVAFGISAIRLEVVLQYWQPLAVLLLSGLAVTLLYVLMVSRLLFKGEYWFEKALFTWGWYTGTMAMGIALLRVVDPKMRSRCLEDYALAYLIIAPVEIALITFAPVAFVHGYGLHFLSAALGLGLLLMALAYGKGWFKQ
ncbi:MAG: sodium/glutamate symporter [Bacteroidales bacterium]|nr:sodium/glutamate symporter [Bacteroidales bacterium]